MASEMETNSLDEDQDMVDSNDASMEVTEVYEKQDSSDDDEDDDNDDEDEEKVERELLKEYSNILEQINQNACINYDHYVRAVDIAYKLNELEKIRESHNLFSSAYPLAPEIWLRWLKIESSVATEPQEIQEVEKLFRKALDDYYCPNVAMEFAIFASKSPNCDMIWEEILSCYALHCFKGREFFVLWRKYFKAKNLLKLEKMEKIVKVFKKELQLPLFEMENSYIELKVMCEINTEISVDWKEIDKKYNKAKENLKIMLPFENQLSELDPKFHEDRAALYKKYIIQVEKFVNVDVLQILYERMVTECCLNETCWIEYINYVNDRELDAIPEELMNYKLFFQNSIEIVKRALRNCTWSENLYKLKMRLFEENDYTKLEVQEVLENALAVGFQTPEPYVNIWLEYLSYLRRQTDYTDEKQVQILRNNFNFAWNSLGKQWGVLADCNCEILQFWGRLEYGPFRNHLKGRELWYTVMESSDNAQKSGLWIEFVQLEMKHDLTATRRVFRKALRHFNELDNVSVIISAWLRFERCNGSLEELKYCEEHCEKIISQINAENKRIEKQNKSSLNKKEKTLKRKHEDHPPTNEISKKNISQSQVKEREGSSSDQTTFKKPTLSDGSRKHVEKQHENDEIDVTKDHLRIFLSNLDYNITENEIQDGFPELKIVNINLIKSAGGRGRGFGYVELESEDEVKKALTLDNRLIKGRPIYISSVLRDKEERRKFKYSDKLEPTKLFVKGIPYDATNEELRSIFEEFGMVKDVRIVYHKSGKSKGIAYIEYENETSASLAIMKLDQHEMRGNVLNVAISAPPPKQKEPVTVKKFLGIAASKKSLRVEQKPRMNLIPTSVRRLPQTPKQSNLNGDHKPVEGKTNDDFRKELLNKK